jgi:hypothetical protein
VGYSRARFGMGTSGRRYSVGTEGRSRCDKLQVKPVRVCMASL